MRRTEPSRALTPRGQALIVHRDAEVAGVVVGATFRASLGNDFAGIAVAERSAASLGWTSALSLRGPDLGRCVAAAALSVFRFLRQERSARHSRFTYIMMTRFIALAAALCFVAVASKASEV